MANVTRPPFVAGDALFTTVAEAYNEVAQSMGNKCLGCLTCQITFADQNIPSRTVKVVGLSGEGDGVRVRRMLNKLRNHFDGVEATPSGTKVYVASTSASRTIYSAVPGTAIEWHTDFPNEYVNRLKFSAVLLSEDIESKGGLSQYTLQHFKEHVENNAISERIRNELDWDAYFNWWLDLASTVDGTLDAKISDFVAILTMSANQVLEACVPHLDENQRAQLVLLMEAASVAGNATAEAVRLAKLICNAGDNPSTEVKHMVNGVAQILLGLVDITQQANKMSSIADLFVRCAEDNCFAEMTNRIESLRQTEGPIVGIEAMWVSTQRSEVDGSQVHKDLCAFCESRFVERTEYILRGYLN